MLPAGIRVLPPGHMPKSSPRLTLGLPEEETQKGGIPYERYALSTSGSILIWLTLIEVKFVCAPSSRPRIRGVSHFPSR